MLRRILTLLLLLLAVGGASPAYAGNLFLKRVYIGNVRPDRSKMKGKVSWDPKLNSLVYLNAGDVQLPNGTIAKVQPEARRNLLENYPPESGRVPKKFRLPAGTKAYNLYVEYLGGSYANLCLHYNQPDKTYVVPEGEERWLSDYTCGMVVSPGTCFNWFILLVTPKPEPKPAPKVPEVPTVRVPVEKKSLVTRDGKECDPPSDLVFPDVTVVVDREVSPKTWEEVERLEFKLGRGRLETMPLDMRYRYRFRELPVPGWAIREPKLGVFYLDLRKEAARLLCFLNEICLPPEKKEVTPPPVSIPVVKKPRVFDADKALLLKAPPGLTLPTVTIRIFEVHEDGSRQEIGSVDIEGHGRQVVPGLDPRRCYVFKEDPVEGWTLSQPKTGEYVIDLAKGVPAELVFVNDLYLPPAEEEPPPPVVTEPPPVPVAPRIVLPPLPYDLPGGYIRRYEIKGPQFGAIGARSNVRCNRCTQPKPKCKCPQKPRNPENPENPGREPPTEGGKKKGNGDGNSPGGGGD